jgi:hypothetical protein
MTTLLSQRAKKALIWNYYEFEGELCSPDEEEFVKRRTPA